MNQPEADSILVQSRLDLIECGPFFCQARTEIVVELDLVTLESDVTMPPCPLKDKPLLVVVVEPL